MPTPNGIEAKLDSLTDYVKTRDAENEKGTDMAKTIIIAMGILLVVVLFLAAGTVGYDIGYDAAVSDMSAKMIRQSLNITF